MLTDYSPGYADTWQQLERRIDDVLWLGSAAAGAAALPQLLLQALTRAASQQQGVGTDRAGQQGQGEGSGSSSTAGAAAQSSDQRAGRQASG